MKNALNEKQSPANGMTLIEVVIFTVLLSLLITNTINYLYSIHLQDIHLINEIYDAQEEQLD